ncbi:hypothetical protein ACWGOQ_0006965 [Aquimarina sp. M1]
MHSRTELQELLSMLSVAERKYYKAAKEVQTVPLSRFLNHQNVIRNKYYFELREVCFYNNIYLESVVDDSLENIIKEKYNLNIHSVNFRYIPLVSRCLEYDQELIVKCAELLKNKMISVDILEIVTKMMTYIIFQGIEGEAIIDRIHFEELQRKRLMRLDNRKYLN